MERQRVRLGELLVGAKIISPEQLQEVLALQRQDGRRLGALLVAGGYVSETQVTQILSQQLSVPWVSLHHIDFSRQLLNLVQRELAERHCLIPIYVRRSRYQRETLYIAMDDPTDVEARAEVELYAGLPVRPMIAPPSEIRAAIRVYYGGEGPPPVPPRPAGSRAPAAPTRSAPSLPARPVAQSAETTDAETTDAEAEVAVVDGAPAQGVATSVVPDSGEKPAVPPLEAPPPPEMSSSEAEETGPLSSPVQARETSMPAPKAGDSPAEMVTLTLLDGTQLNLPAARRIAKKSDGDMLTAGDLVAALRAHASGADTSQVLGSDIDWQRVCAALLAVLLRKRLIADWEFVEELRR